MRKFFFTVALCFFSSGAWAQCNGTFPAGTVCGNSQSIEAPPSWTGGSGTINPTDPAYGAVCDGNHNDQAAFQSAINAAIATNQILTWRGTCRISSTLTVNGYLRVRGQGLLNSSINADTNITVFHNTSHIGDYSDFNIQFNNAHPCGLSQTNSASVAFQLDPTSFNGGTFDTIWVNCAYNAFFMNGDSNGVARNIQLTNVNHYGFDFETNGTTPSEDWEISSSPGFTPDGTSLGAEVVHCASCWGLRYMHNKTNGASAGWQYGINLAANFADGDLFIGNNSFEGFTSLTSGAVVRISRTSNSVGFGGTVVITGNELIGPVGVNMPTDVSSPTTQWFTNLVITGNIIGNVQTAAVSLDNMVGLVYSNNTIQATGGARPAVIGPHVTSGFVGFNPCYNSNFTNPSSISACLTSTISGSVVTGAPF